MKSKVPKVDKRIAYKENKSDEILSYDSDNLYPQRILQIVNSSGSAKRSTEVYSKFIQGKGFKDELFYNAVVNSSGLTTDKLLSLVANDFATYGGKAIHVNYNGLLQKTDVSHIPFEYCRLGIGSKAGMIAVYDDWECEKGRFDKSKIKWYYKFNDRANVLLSEISKSGGIENYEGQIFYESKYPLAPIDPVINDVISDNSIQLFTKNELENGFNPSVIARYSKSFDGEEGEEEWEAEANNWRALQGAENTSKVLMIGGTSKDDFSLERLGDSGYDKMYDLTEKRIKNSIIQRYGQPPSIVGRRDQNAVFSSQNIEDDTKFYNHVTYSERLILEQDFKKIFANFYKDINETNDYSIIELTFFSVNTENPSLVSRLGVAGVQGVMSVIQSQMSNEQKINSLQIIYGISNEEAIKLVLPVTP
jgi:hypothetical protein